MVAMARFSVKSIALKWYYFSCQGSSNLYREYFSLFMKQLGFNPAQIGLTTLFGVMNLFIPLCLLFGEKFRARKIVIVVVTVTVLICYTLPVSALIIPPLHPMCNSTTSNNSLEVKQQQILRNGSMHLKHGKDASEPLFALRSTSVFTRPKVTMSSQHSEFTRDSHYTTPPSGFKTYPLTYFTTNSSVPVENSFHFTSSNNTTHSSDHSDVRPQRLLSALFFVLLLSRSLTWCFDCVNLSLVNLATVTFLKEENASYGAYYMWSYVGTALSASCVAVLAWFVRISICGVEIYGYFIAFCWGGLVTTLSLVSLPWLMFEYSEKKSFNWSGVKSDIFNMHYVFIFIVLFYTALCSAFQAYWEFWYLDELSASPLLLAGTVSIRRGFLAVFTLSSTYLIRKIGDLQTVCIALFLYSSSFLALSFTRIAWLVLVIDTFQAAALGISYCAFTVVFYKAASKENASMILGRSSDQSPSRELSWCLW
jgi:hypothetical protein